MRPVRRPNPLESPHGHDRIHRYRRPGAVFGAAGVMAGRAAKAMAGGDMAAGARLPVHGMIGVALMLLLLAFGILSFR